MLKLKFEQHPNLCERVTWLLFMTLVLYFLYLYYNYRVHSMYLSRLHKFPFAYNLSNRLNEVN